MNKFGIPIDNEVGIVGCKNNLSFIFLLLNQVNKIFCNMTT